MDMLATFGRLFEYDAWANREALASLEAADPAPERALSVLAHVAGAKHLWLARLRADPAMPGPWPVLAPEALAARLDELAVQMRSYLAGLRPDDLVRTVRYTNSNGETFSSSVGDILLQLVSHGSYHRGQVAVLLRTAGKQPVNTDYIHAVRSGVVG